MSRATPAQSRHGFTLIEILIVVVILGILAGIVMPQFSTASTNARESTLREDLRYLRTQISAFKYQHREVLPGYPAGDVTQTPDETAFLSQMTGFTDDACDVAAAPSTQYRYGPYLTKMPSNPFTGKSHVLVVTDATMPPADATQNYGWIYNPVLEKLTVNQVGVDTAGHDFASY